jgi:hypothetical protein
LAVVPPDAEIPPLLDAPPDALDALDAPLLVAPADAVVPPLLDAPPDALEPLLLLELSRPLLPPWPEVAVSSFEQASNPPQATIASDQGKREHRRAFMGTSAGARG